MVCDAPFANVVWREVVGFGGEDYHGIFNIGNGFKSQTIMPNVVVAEYSTNTIIVDLPGVFDERAVAKKQADSG